jgi:putative FmdB family regulatory protein
MSSNARLESFAVLLRTPRVGCVVIGKDDMPIYEYECRQCGHRFEQLLLPTTTAACPSCSGKDLERLVSLPAVSSDNTRQSAIKQARKLGEKTRREKAHAEREYERKVHDDHH